MNKVLNLTEFKDNLLFTSDWHINHDREWIVDKRGFASIEAHNNWIFDQWNTHVNSDTVVVNLGDVTFSDPKVEHFRRVANLPCKKHYVLNGNHCSGMKQYYQNALHLLYPSMPKFNSNSASHDLEIYPLDMTDCEVMTSNLCFLGYQTWARVGKQAFVISHFPQRVWENVGRGAWMISGHSHGSDPGRIPEAKTGKQLDVGIDVAKSYNGTAFFTYAELERIMNKKSVVLVDHHDSRTNPS